MDIIKPHSFQLNMFNYYGQLKKIYYKHHFRNSGGRVTAGRILLETPTKRDNSLITILLALSAPPGACVCGFLYEDLLKLRFTNTSPGRRQSPPASRAGQISCDPLSPQVSVQVSPIPVLLAYNPSELPSEGLCLT